MGLGEKDDRVSARYHYDEFGIPLDDKKFDLNRPGPDNLFGYTGLGYGYNDGLTYARARYYQPEIGRFISEDTYKGTLGSPQSQNRYTYVHNNPLKWIDPSGYVAVNPIVWELNKQLNDLKGEWAKQNKAGNIKLRDKAEADSKKLRDDFLKIAEGLNPLATQGLLMDTDSMLVYRPYEGKDGGYMEIALDSAGTVYYEADFMKYDYYEQLHVESKAENVMGSLAKAAAGYFAGYYTGKLAKRPNTEHIVGVAGGWATDKYIPGLPDVGDRKTMIYRTNRKTGQTDHMIINTNSYNILGWEKLWREYK
ncbi:RHS repeat-associated core domain-containing protein [Paenibacillus sp. KQZ6P-2]|uniref:RHS repeat-associated core domain-containing protein n=1 Tax=Paenibacillus mangrovi TaxID=2931978 RepID=A0A9X1WVZ7_9BACL|nr:RHS repeat-associated core domain-containing protein [Paenibacillus mangrovi]MCJ8014563.1 RHS repeat-associated core domain-containing protein [Paenibacillus mangrovi]